MTHGFEQGDWSSRVPSVTAPMINLKVFLSFQGGLFKMYRIYKKILHAYQGDFKTLVKSGMF